MKKVLIPALLLTLAVASCSKNDDPTPTEGTSKKLLSRVEGPDGDVSKFTYDANGRLLSVADSSDDGTQTDSAIYKNGILTDAYYRGRTGAGNPNYGFVFDASNRLTRINYTYNDPIIRFDSVVYNGTGAMGMVYNILIDENGKHNIIGTDEIAVDGNGNVTSVLSKEVAGDQVLTLKRKEVYTYDNKVSPMTRIASQPFWLVLWGYHYAGKNNVNRVEVYRYPNGTAELTELYTAKYTYDADGDIIATESFEGTSDANLQSEGVTTYKYSK
jgi:YD repeat-containing protein